MLGFFFIFVQSQEEKCRHVNNPNTKLFKEAISLVLTSGVNPQGREYKINPGRVCSQTDPGWKT